MRIYFPEYSGWELHLGCLADLAGCFSLFPATSPRRPAETGGCQRVHTRGPSSQRSVQQGAGLHTHWAASKQDSPAWREYEASKTPWYLPVGPPCPEKVCCYCVRMWDSPSWRECGDRVGFGPLFLQTTEATGHTGRAAQVE